MKKTMFIILLVMIISLTNVVSSGYCKGGFPHFFYGNIDINDNPTQIGTEILAVLNGEISLFNNTKINTTMRSNYNTTALGIYGSDSSDDKLAISGYVKGNGYTSIPTIVFKILIDNTWVYSGNHSYHCGSVDNLNLSALYDTEDEPEIPDNETEPPIEPPEYNETDPPIDNETNTTDPPETPIINETNQTDYNYTPSPVIIKKEETKYGGRSGGIFAFTRSGSSMFYYIRLGNRYPFFYFTPCNQRKQTVIERLELIEISDDTAVIKFENIKVNINSKNYSYVDLNNDGYYNLKLKIIESFSNKAKIEFIPICQKKEVEEILKEIIIEEIKEPIEVSTTPKIDEHPIKKEPKRFPYGVVAVIIIIMGFSWMIYKTKKGE